MSEKVESMIFNSVQSLVDRDKKLAHQTVSIDRDVNRAEDEIREYVLEFISTNDVPYNDLRFLMSTLKLASHLERIGNYAASISERAIELACIPPLKPYIDIPRMTKLCIREMDDLIGAFFSGDVKTATKIAAKDDEIDELYHRTYRELIEIMSAKGTSVEPGVRILAVSKNLERIGDHLVYIAHLVEHVHATHAVPG
jgi:phosphate transport system protein